MAEVDGVPAEQIGMVRGKIGKDGLQHWRFTSAQCKGCCPSCARTTPNRDGPRTGRRYAELESCRSQALSSGAGRPCLWCRPPQLSVPRPTARRAFSTCTQSCAVMPAAAPARSEHADTKESAACTRLEVALSLVVKAR